MLLSRIVALSFLTLCTNAMADTIDLNLRNSSAQFQYSSAMSRDSLGKSELHVGGIYSDSNNTNNTLGELGIEVKDEIGSKAPGFSVGIGIKGLLAHTQGTNESAVAIGGMLRYSPPTLSRLGMVGQLYFAPNITTFGDADRFVETSVRLEFEVIPSAAAYIGYRNIYFNLNNGPNAKVDQGAFVGVRMSF
jgi:YfaZ precursor